MGWAALIVGVLTLPALSQDEAREQWKAQIEQRRIQAAEGAKANADQPPAAPQSQPSNAAPAGQKRGIIINGKTITSKQKNFAPPPPSTASPGGAASPLPLSATATVPAATAQPSPPTQPLPAPTPAMVKIKKTQIVGGKILTVEIEVTPTPSPAVAPGAVTAATAPVPAAQAPIASATGLMLEVREKLTIASNSPTGSMRFEPKLIAKMREEFMAAKGKPHVAAILPPTREVMIQSHLQRLSSVARGGNIDKETAQILIQVLFPPEQPVQPPTAPPPQAPPGVAATAPNAVPPAAPPVESPPPVEQPPAPQPQIFIDQYGRYVYEDGTPLLDENGQEIYYEAPQGYYDENGVYHESGG